MNQVDATIEWLFANEAKEMKKICNKEMAKFGGIYEMDHHNFYSQVGWDISKAKERYDSSKGKSFKDYIYGVIRLSVCKEMSRRNRGKRQMTVEKEVVDENGNVITEKEYIPNVSLDAPIKEENNITIVDTLQSDFDIDVAISETTECGYSDKMEIFLSSLSETPRKIAEMIMSGYSVEDIKEKLGLTDKEYQDSWKMISSYEKKRILYEENNNVEDDEMNTTVLTEDVAESYKNTSYSIDSISKQLQKKRIRDDHILQRHSGQWKGFAKSELISDILRGKSLTQIIISEEIKNGLRMQWLIDGKQRCTTLDDYLHDGFAISKNVKNYNIRYQTTKIDEAGYEVLNEDGFTEMEFKEFDIRGKKFSQLPEELQEIFKDRQIPVLYNMNCTKKDIADDIARFNRSRPMNKAQNGWLGLEESFAEFVENIAKMQFFQSDFAGSTYTNNNNTSGMIRRIIVEGIMASDFIDDFSKDFEKMCEFLSDEASDSNFTEFYSFIERLTPICNKDVAKMFNAKDSFLWFGLFSRFTKYGVDDNNFIDFMIEFNNSLHSKKVGDNSFDDLCIDKKTGNSRSTKDKYIVVQKMELLEVLMKEFLHIEDPKIESKEEFIAQNVELPIEEVNQDMDTYEETLTELEDNTIRDGSKLLNEENRLSLLAMVAYSYKNDVDLDDWLEDYASKNNTYFVDQRKNFHFMLKSLTEYNKRMAVR